MNNFTSASEIALVFDLDGTLLDSVPDLAAAANKVLASVTREPMELAEIQSFVGNGVPHLVQCVMKARNLPLSASVELTALFLEFYSAARMDLSKPFLGVEEALARLMRSGISLGLCTNKPEAPTQAILRHLGWNDLFGVVVAGDTLPYRKPDPRPLLHAAEHMARPVTIYVGDSEVDCETAKAADMLFLLFEGGYRKTPLSELYFSATFLSFNQFETTLNALCNNLRR